MKQVTRMGGTLIRTGTGKGIHQHTYVGNTAWAFICAEKALCINPLASGEAYFITDDTPASDSYALVAPFFVARGMRISSFRVPFWLIFGFVYLAEWLICILSPVVKLDIGISTDVIMFVNASITLKSDKARSLLNYSPLFSAEESMRNALSYYKDVPL